jgi:hypothetical protein
MKINITKITPTSYAFKADGFEFHAKSDPNTGRWIVPSFVAGDFNVLSQNTAQLSYNQVAQFLRKNPLFMDTKTIDGASGKRIYKNNPVFS